MQTLITETWFIHKQLARDNWDDHAEAVFRTLQEVEVSAGKLRTEVVHQLRLLGAPWSQIGAHLGISRQSAWEKYAPLADEATRPE